jgi:hypothetical protein
VAAGVVRIDGVAVGFHRIPRKLLRFKELSNRIGKGTSNVGPGAFGTGGQSSADAARHSDKLVCHRPRGPCCMA